MKCRFQKVCSVIVSLVVMLSLIYLPSLTKIVLADPVDRTQAVNISGDGKSNVAQVVYTASSDVSLEVVSKKIISGNNVGLEVTAYADTLNVTIYTKDYAPLKDISIEVTVRGNADFSLSKAGLFYDTRSNPNPTATPTPVVTATPSPTPSPTPAPTNTPVPETTTTTTTTTTIQTTTAAPTTKAKETTKETQATTESTTVTETLEPSESTTVEETTTSEATETTSETEETAVLPVDDTSETDQEPSETDPVTKKPSKKKKKSKNKEESSHSLIWIIVGSVAGVIVIGAVCFFGVKKKKSSVPAEGDAPVVMNGYLQKPTVGTAAAQAMRPIRSNVSQPAKPRKENAPTAAPQSMPQSMPQVAPQAPMQAAPVVPAVVEQGDVTLPEEMLKEQQDLERKMSELSEEMEKMSRLGEDGEPPKE